VPKRGGGPDQAFASPPIVRRLRGNDKSAFSRYSKSWDRNFDRTKLFFLKKIVAFEWICIRIPSYWNFRELSDSQFHLPEMPSGFKGLNLDSRWNRWLFVHSRAYNWKLRRNAVIRIALRDLHSRCVLIHLKPWSLYFGSSSPPLEVQFVRTHIEFSSFLISLCAKTLLALY
jgi:hypothetical protein